MLIHVTQRPAKTFRHKNVMRHLNAELSCAFLCLSFRLPPLLLMFRLKCRATNLTASKPETFHDLMGKFPQWNWNFRSEANRLRLKFLDKYFSLFLCSFRVVEKTLLHLFALLKFHFLQYLQKTFMLHQPQRSWKRRQFFGDDERKFFCVWGNEKNFFHLLATFPFTSWTRAARSTEGEMRKQLANTNILGSGE